MTTWTITTTDIADPAVRRAMEQRNIAPVWTCAIIGHEHADQAEAQQCVAWLYDNWDELAPTGLPVRDEWLEQWSSKNA